MWNNNTSIERQGRKDSQLSPLGKSQGYFPGAVLCVFVSWRAEAMRKRYINSLYVAFLLLLFVFLAGCEPSLDFEVDNQLDQPVAVFWKAYVKGEWGRTYDRGRIEPGTTQTRMVNNRYPLDAQRKYYFEARTVEGEVICSWEFAHEQIEGNRVVLLLPSCDSYEEGKPWRGVFGWLFQK